MRRPSRAAGGTGSISCGWWEGRARLLALGHCEAINAAIDAEPSRRTKIDDGGRGRWRCWATPRRVSGWKTRRMVNKPCAKQLCRLLSGPKSVITTGFPVVFPRVRTAVGMRPLAFSRLAQQCFHAEPFCCAVPCDVASCRSRYVESDRSLTVLRRDESWLGSHFNDRWRSCSQQSVYPPRREGAKLCARTSWLVDGQIRIH